MDRRKAIRLFGTLGLFGLFASSKTETQEFERGQWYCGLCKVKREIPSDTICRNCGAGLFLKANES